MKRGRMDQKKKGGSYWNASQSGVYECTAGLLMDLCRLMWFDISGRNSSEARDRNVHIVFTFSLLLQNESDLSQMILRQINSMFFWKNKSVASSVYVTFYSWWTDWHWTLMFYWSHQCFVWTNQMLIFPQSVSGHFQLNLIRWSVLGENQSKFLFSCRMLFVKAIQILFLDLAGH